MLRHLSLTSREPAWQASKNREPLISDTYKLLVNGSQTHVVFNLSSQVTEDSLVYSNVIVYSPLPSPDGVLRQEGAVIPVQCQYRRYADKPQISTFWISFSLTFFFVLHPL